MKKSSVTADPIRDVPITDWSAVGHRGHGVQFYSSDNHLIDLLARYIGTALVTGEIGLVVATEDHRNALEKRLKACGLDVAVARRQSRYIPLDAKKTLRRLMRNTWPDATQFKKVIGGLIERVTAAAGQPRRVYAFGEMIALLCAEGRLDAAVRFEELWNELAQTTPFSLCCAYPMTGFSEGSAAPFMRICAQHSHVFPAAVADPATGHPTA